MKKNVIMLLPLLLSLTLVGCNNEGSSSSSSSSSSKPSISSTISSSTTNSSSTSTSSTISKTKLASVENFKVNRNEEGKWVFNFDTVENALSYHLTGVVGENSFFEGDVTNDQVVEAGEEAGTYIFSFIAQNPDYLDSEAATYEIAVEIYNETDIGGIKYTGRKENEVPVGNYHLVYGDGSTFDGTLTADFKRANGKHQYTNLMYYEGEFNNDAFEGEGMFTWSTTGDYKDGSTYMGKFVGGNYNDQVGTFYTAAYWTKPVDYNGILTFTGTMGPAFGAPGKAGTVGKGEFSFANNSIYSGDLLKGNGDWDFLRQGWGKNAWTVTEAAGWITGGNAEYTIDNFEGEFDSTGHAWIYGNGIWYFKKDGQPYGYVKGKWDGGSRLGDSDIELVIQDEYKDAIDLTSSL